MSVDITAGTVEPLEVYVQKASDGTALTGSSNLKVQIRRSADGYFLDFNDSTFKASGWTTKQAALTEVSSSNAPGFYHYDTTGIDTTGWTTGIYLVTFLEATTAAALGAPYFANGEIRIVTATPTSLSARIPSALVSGRMDASVGAVATGAMTAAGFAANAITSTVIAADAIGASQIAADAIGSSELAASAANEIADALLDRALSGHTTSGTTGEAISNAASKAADIQTRLPAALVSGRIDASVGATQTSAIGAAGFAAGAITSTVLADDAITGAKIAAGAITSSEAPALANLDVASSTLATASALGSVATDAGNAASRAADLQSRTPAALVSGRMDVSIGAVQTGAITAGGFAANAITSSVLAANCISSSQLAAGCITSTTIAAGAVNSTVAPNLDAAVSTRATPSDVTTAASGAVTSINAHTDSAVSPLATAASVATLLAILAAASPTAATGNSTTVVRSSATQADNFFNGMVLVVIHSTGVAARRITTYANTNGAFTLDAALPFTPSAADQMYVLAVPASLSASQVESAVLDAALASHTGAGTPGQNLARVDATVSSRAAPGAAMTLADDAVSAAAISTAGAAKIAGATMDEPLAGHATAGTAGANLTRIDVTLSTRAATGAAMALTSGERATLATAVDSVLTASHGGGGWITATGFAVAGDAMLLTSPGYAAVADAVWDETLAGHVISGTTGAKLGSLVAAPTATAVAAEVWATAVGTPTTGTFGWYVRRMFQHDYNRQEISSIGILTIYDDNASTPLATVTLRDVGGSALSVTTGTPARRAAAVFA